MVGVATPVETMNIVHKILDDVGGDEVLWVLEDLGFSEKMEEDLRGLVLCYAAQVVDIASTGLIL